MENRKLLPSKPLRNDRPSSFGESSLMGVLNWQSQGKGLKLKGSKTGAHEEN